MPQVPYTTADSLSASDLEYLGARAAKSPAICQLLKLGEVVRNQQQIVTKLDNDAGVTDTNYNTLLTDDPST